MVEPDGEPSAAVTGVAASSAAVRVAPGSDPRAVRPVLGGAGRAALPACRRFERASGPVPAGVGGGRWISVGPASVGAAVPGRTGGAVDTVAAPAAGPLITLNPVIAPAVDTAWSVLWELPAAELERAWPALLAPELPLDGELVVPRPPPPEV